MYCEAVGNKPSQYYTCSLTTWRPTHVSSKTSSLAAEFEKTEQLWGSSDFFPFVQRIKRDAGDLVGSGNASRVSWRRQTVLVLLSLVWGIQVWIWINGIREYWMIYRELGFLAVIWFGSTRSAPPSPVSMIDRRHTGRLRKRDILLRGGGGRGRVWAWTKEL